jgi:hypothetical protein
MMQVRKIFEIRDVDSYIISDLHWTTRSSKRRATIASGILMAALSEKSSGRQGKCRTRGVDAAQPTVHEGLPATLAIGTGFL